MREANDADLPEPDADPERRSPIDLESSRRSFIRGAILYAMFVGMGVSVSGCGGGGGGDGGFGGGAGGGGTPGGTPSPFVHGVASGDPLFDRAILWTRVTMASPGMLNLRWEVASDANFGAIVASGTASTGPDQDYTVKVDATGLQPASVYYYRFYVGSEPSPTGRTKTLPVGNVALLRLGVVSCSNFPAGYFNVCAELAKRTDVDLVLHLGDYIYEYGPLGFASQLAIAIDRESQPPKELLTLADYRQRHAQYRTDLDLVALHAKMPVIAVWDDHDVTDNAWSGGASNRDSATEGTFAARRAAAIQRALLAQRRVPYNLDAWDGHPAARETVLAGARSMGKNLVSLAGDTHNAWASNLTDVTGQRAGVEFACASISSPGLEILLPLISGPALTEAFPEMVKDLRYAETSKRGFLVLTLTPAEARADWTEVSTVFSRSYTARLAKSLHALPGAANLDVVPV